MQTHQKISLTLNRIADNLQRYSKDRRHPPEQRHLCVRFASFARQLGRREVFCRKLANKTIPGPFMEASYHELISQYIPVVYEFRLPGEPPFALNDWALLLAYAANENDQFKPRMLETMANNWGESVELQLKYDGTVGQGLELKDKLPVVRHINVKLPRNHTKTHVRERLKDSLRRPISSFVRKIRRLPGPGFAGFRVSLFTSKGKVRIESVTDEPHEVVKRFNIVTDVNPSTETTLTFTVSIEKRRRVASILAEIAVKLLNLLDERLSYKSAQGRLPDAESQALWWSKVVFEGRKVKEIAECLIEDEEKIASALRRLGIQRQTK